MDLNEPPAEDREFDMPFIVVECRLCRRVCLQKRLNRNPMHRQSQLLIMVLSHLLALGTGNLLPELKDSNG